MTLSLEVLIRIVSNGSRYETDQFSYVVSAKVIWYYYR